jgi:hypothetical protein
MLQLDNSATSQVFLIVFIIEAERDCLESGKGCRNVDFIERNIING